MATPTIRLSSGFDIPAIGFGTYPLRGEDGVSAVHSAIDVGYRLIDTAFNYDNEAAVGQAIAASGIPREELFITSKLPGRFHERPHADDTVRESLWRLGLDYLDLYLIHWPNPIQGHYVEAWQALIDARDAGLVRSIGVSNFTVKHLHDLEAATGELPAVNQVELHPYFPQIELVEQLHQMGIQPESWSPLGKAARPHAESVVGKIAATHAVTPAQVVLRWQIQRGSIPIPKSADPVRQAQNLDVFGFELSEDEVSAITALGRPAGRLFDGDPDIHEEM